MYFKKLFRTKRNELRNFRQIAHWNRYLIQRRAEPKQCEHGIALDQWFPSTVPRHSNVPRNDYWRAVKRSHF